MALVFISMWVSARAMVMLARIIEEHHRIRVAEREAAAQPQDKTPQQWQRSRDEQGRFIPVTPRNQEEAP